MVDFNVGVLIPHGASTPMLEESYKNGKRVQKGDPTATWEVQCVSWGWDAVNRTGPEPRGRVNFPKFAQAESWAIESSKSDTNWPRGI